MFRQMFGCVNGHVPQEDHSFLFSGKFSMSVEVCFTARTSIYLELSSPNHIHRHILFFIIIIKFSTPVFVEFIAVWMIANTLKSCLSILTDLNNTVVTLVPIFCLISSSSFLFPIFWRSFQAYQLQLVKPSTEFSAICHDPCVCE